MNTYIIVHSKYLFLSNIMLFKITAINIFELKQKKYKWNIHHFAEQYVYKIKNKDLWIRIFDIEEFNKYIYYFEKECPRDTLKIIYSKPEYKTMMELFNI